jgi:hypothetical protein
MIETFEEISAKNIVDRFSGSDKHSILLDPSSPAYLDLLTPSKGLLSGSN